MEKKSRKERVTEELSKMVSLLTQAGVIISMLTGAVYWVNAQFSLSDKYAEKVAGMASAMVISELAKKDNLVDTVLHQKVDSYLDLTESLFLLAEDGLNSQDSVFLMLQDLEVVAKGLKRDIVLQGNSLDSLHSVLTTGFTDVEKRYERDSIRAAYEELQARWRFSQLMDRARKDNATLLRELREPGTPKRIKRFKIKRTF